MDSWDIQRLARSHDRSGFDGGNDRLNDWLRKRSSQWDKKRLARVYVAVPKNELRVVGHYAISSHHVSYEALPDGQARGLPRIDVPVVLLGQLAVDRTVQGQGLGKFLLVDALRRAQYVADEFGVQAVEVAAIDEAARLSLIQKLGLPPLDRPNA